MRDKILPEVVFVCDIFLGFFFSTFPMVAGI